MIADAPPAPALRHPVHVGTAGWQIPRDHAAAFPREGSCLARYAAVLNGAEINSTFYRRHRTSTFARWAETVHPDFRFAVKVPQAITHDAALARPMRLLDELFADIGALGDRMGPLLVQLPPSLAFERRRADAFFRAVRARFGGSVVCEPRHATWLTASAEALLVDHDVARVAADPPRPPGADCPGGARALVYVRLHGSPSMYRTPYGPERLARIAGRIREESAHRPVFCVLDNTASGAAAGDALLLTRLLGLG